MAGNQMFTANNDRGMDVSVGSLAATAQAVIRGERDGCFNFSLGKR